MKLWVCESKGHWIVAYTVAIVDTKEQAIELMNQELLKNGCPPINPDVDNLVSHDITAPIAITVFNGDY